MAPPLPLSTVAGTLALSFTTGRAAPTAPVQEPVSVPSPPTLPPLPGETEPTPTEPEPATDPVTAEPTTPEPDVPEPEPTVAPPPIQPREIDRERPDDRGWADEDPEEERLLRSNRRPLMFTLFAGGARVLRGGYSLLNDFKIEGALGGFGPRFRTGGFVVVQMTKGLPFTTFTLAPRLSFNRQIVPNHAFYFTTNITVGYRASTYRDTSTPVYGDGYGYSGGGGGSSRITYHSAVMGVSWGASAIIAERLLLSFRPADLELVAPAASEDAIQLNWSVMAGLGVVWGGPS